MSVVAEPAPEVRPARPARPARPFRRRVVINGLATTAGNAWSILVSAIAFPVTLHGLGASAFGTWALVQTFSAFTGWLALGELGVGTAATRAIATATALEDEARASRLVGTTIAWFAVAGVVAAGGFAVFGRVAMADLFRIDEGSRGVLGTVVVVFAVQIVVDFVIRGVHFSLEGRNRVDLARANDALRRTACVGGAAAAAVGGAGLRGVALASLAGTVPALALGAAMLRRCGARVGAPSGAELRELLRYGREVAVLRPIGVIHRTMDRVIVGATLGPAAVAVVEVATQVATAADSVLSAASYAVTPTASWLDAKGERGRTGALLVQGTFVAVLVTVPFVLVPAVLAGPLVRVWLDDTSATTPALVVLALAYIGLTAPVQVGSNLLVGVGAARAVLRAALAAVAVNLVASLVLVDAVGVKGPFVATLLSAPFLVVPLWRSAAARAGVGSGELLRRGVLPSLRPAAALTVVLVACALAPVSDVVRLVSGALAGAVVYGAAVLAFAVGPEWRERVLTLDGRLAR